MPKKDNILNFFASFGHEIVRYCSVILLVIFSQNVLLSSNPIMVSVYAGEDQTICKNDTLQLINLEAEITGLVTDGYWFTSGDGKFLPSNESNGQFSITQQYVPGIQDKINGGCDLILVSFDPDGFGPMVQVTDMVHITFMGNIAIVCNNNLNISLGPNCTQLVDPTMLVANIMEPVSYYTLSIKDAQNHIIPGNLLTGDHIGKLLEYTVGHECGTNTCWGYLNVQDKLAPTMNCVNHTVFCGAYTQADSIGLPIPSLAKAKKTGPYAYRVTGLDACGPAYLSFTDSYTAMTCETGIQGRITRTWVAKDSFSNTSSCFQVITIKNKNFSQIKLPPYYDDTAKPAFECGGNWPALGNGHPSPDTTGMPDTEGCTNLESTYTDAVFAACGSSYKILRKWTIVNWCGTTFTDYNQLILIKDSKAPEFICPADLTLNTSPYNCFTGQEKLPLPAEIKDCSEVSISMQLQ